MNENIQEILNDIRERLVRVETKIDDIQNLRDKVNTSYNLASNVMDRIQKLEENQKWVWRSFAGAIITSIVAWFMKFKG